MSRLSGGQDEVGAVVSDHKAIFIPVTSLSTLLSNLAKSVYELQIHNLFDCV